jgi:hypothetical protein
LMLQTACLRAVSPPLALLLQTQLSMQVFDARQMLAPLATVMPYGPADLLAWSPVESMSLMVGSSSGLFAFMDVGNPTTAEPYQVCVSVCVWGPVCVCVGGGAVGRGKTYWGLWQGLLGSRSVGTQGKTVVDAFL